jgi:site-specific recombinase XerD
MKLTDARDMWLRALRAEGASPATLDIYSSAVDRFIDYQRAHHDPVSLEGIERRHVEGFLSHLQDTRSQATAHNRYRCLRALFNYCADGGDERTVRREPLGIIELSPMRRMRPPKLDEHPVPLLSPEQVDALWAHTERPGKDFTRRRDAAIIRMFLATGIRAGEMAALTLSDVNLDAQILNVAGKGRKWRRVPYSGPAAIALDRYLAIRSTNRWAARSDRVWLSVKGSMTRSGLQQMLERVGGRVGIPDLHPHRLRHTAVDAMFSAGMTEGEVMALMGWSTAAMCRRYASARRAARAIDTYRRLGIGDPYSRKRV